MAGTHLPTIPLAPELEDNDRPPIPPPEDYDDEPPPYIPDEVFLPSATQVKAKIAEKIASHSAREAYQRNTARVKGEYDRRIRQIKAENKFQKYMNESTDARARKTNLCYVLNRRYAQCKKFPDIYQDVLNFEWPKRGFTPEKMSLDELEYFNDVTARMVAEVQLPELFKTGLRQAGRGLQYTLLLLGLPAQRVKDKIEDELASGTWDDDITQVAIEMKDWLMLSPKKRLGLNILTTVANTIQENYRNATPTPELQQRVSDL